MVRLSDDDVLFVGATWVGTANKAEYWIKRIFRFAPGGQRWIDVVNPSGEYGHEVSDGMWKWGRSARIAPGLAIVLSDGRVLVAGGHALEVSALGTRRFSTRTAGAGPPPSV